MYGLIISIFMVVLHFFLRKETINIEDRMMLTCGWGRRGEARSLRWGWV